MTTCSLCGSNEATIYFKGVLNEQSIKLHLCESCAKKKGIAFPFEKPDFSIGEMVAHLTAAASAGTASAGARCPVCGLTFMEFKESGQLGCSQCYTVFAPVIGPLLKHIHGAAKHTGKQAARTVRATPLSQEVKTLKADLKHAIDHEAFEEAARLRDRIQDLEKQMKLPPLSGEPRQTSGGPPTGERR